MGAILATSSLLLATAPVEAAPGDLDTTFGGGDGRVTISAGADFDSLIVHEIEVAPDGGTFVLTQLPLGLSTRLAVVRFDPAGDLDTAWNGGQPIFAFQDGENTQTITIAVDSAGRLVIGTGALVFRYTTSGAPDPTFSGDGAADINPAQGFQVADIEALSGDALVLLGRREFATPKLMVARLTSAGVLDTGFSGDGRAEVPSPDAPGSSGVDGLDLDVGADGSLWTLGVDSSRNTSVAKLSAAGAPVVAFGGNGIAPTPAQPNYKAELAIDGDGRPLAIAPTTSGVEVARLTSTGAPDESYGPGGLALVPGIEAIGNRIIVGGSIAYVTSGTDGQPAVAAIDLTDATLEPTFGPGGADGDGIQTVPTDPVDVGGAFDGDLTASGQLRIVLVSYDDETDDRNSELVQLTTVGADDLSYSFDGRSKAGIPHHRTGTAVAVDEGPDGQIVVALDGEPALDPNAAVGVVAKVDSAGLPVATFGEGGRVEIATDDPMVAIRDVLALPDGRVAVLFRESFHWGLSYLMVLGVDGSPDPSFGTGGRTEVGIGIEELGPTSLARAGSGDDLALFVAGRPEDSTKDIYVRRITLDGEIDTTYGAQDGSDDGWIGIDYPVREDVLDKRLIAGAPDGSIVWAAPAITAGEGDGLALGRLLATGAVDATFGVGGLRLVAGAPGPAGGTLDDPLHLERRPDGGADLLAGRHNGLVGAVAVRVTSTGALDPTYSGDGVAVLMTSTPQRIAGATMQGDRALFLQGRDAATQLIRFNASGAPDTTFGPGGIRSSTYPLTVATFGDNNQRDLRTNLLADTTGAAVFASHRPSAGGVGTAGRDGELVKVSTEPSAPAAPTNVSATKGDGSAVVSWSPPGSDGGAPITGYTVTANTGQTCTDAAAPLFCTVTGLTNGVTYTFTVTATNAIGTSAPSAASNPVTPTAGAGNLLALPNPQRFADSRVGFGDTDDEQQERFGALNAGTFRAIPIAGRLGIPADADNAILSVVAVNPTAGGYLTVWPCGTAMPSTSNLNYRKAVNLAGTVLTKLGSAGADDGKVCVYTSAKTDLIVDVAGSMKPTAFLPLPTPKRMADSRNPTGDTDDEQQERFGALAAGSVRAIPIAGRLGIPTDADNAVLSIVAVNPTAGGYLTIWPCGAPMPSTSNLNYTRAVTLANTVTTKLGSGGANAGKVCVYTSARTDLIVDAAGTLDPAAFLSLPNPQRFADSRNPTGDTDDEQQERFGALNAGTSRAIPIAGRLGIPADADNAILSVVAVSPVNDGYLTIWPCGSPMPSTSNLNFTKGVNLANTVITTLGTTGTNDGKVCVYTSARTDLIIDTSGTIA